MALTRAMLKGMGLTDEQINAIIDEHVSVTSALKESIKEYKEDAEKLPGVQKELDDLKADVKAGDWQNKYTHEHEEYEKFKTDIAAKEKSAALKSAYTKLLNECKVGEKHIDSILRVTDFKDMKLDENGTFENAEEIKKKIEADWSGFIATPSTKGADVNTPPAGGDSGKGG